MIRSTPLPIAFIALFGSIPQLQSQPPAAERSTFDVRQYGATGNKADSATAAIQQAVDACFKAGGGMVYLPPGAYTSGTIELKDNVTLRLEAGATLFLTANTQELRGRNRALIYAEGAKNIAVTGKGTIDGQATYALLPSRGDDPEILREIAAARSAGADMRRYYRTGSQAYMFIINKSTNVLLQDISVINSPLWTMRISECDRVFVRGVYIYSDLEKGVNADGIDIVSSRNVTISDSIITTADDAIVLKSPVRDKPVENVTVTNCVLTSSSTAMMIGTETYADVRHVIFSNSVIRNSNKAFGINVQDGGTVSDVIFSNITVDTSRRAWNWWGSAETFKFVLKKRTPQSKLGAIRDIVVDNVISHARGTSTITGHAESPLENITVSNVQIFMDEENAPDKRATDAIVADGVNGLKLRNVSVKWAEGKTEPMWQSALRLRNVTDLELINFAGRQGLKTGKDPAVVVENVIDGVIRDSRASAGTGTFLEFRGAKTKDLRLQNNDLSKAAKQLAFTNGALSRSVVLQGTEPAPRPPANQ